MMLFQISLRNVINILLKITIHLFVQHVMIIYEYVKSEWHLEE